MERFSFLFHQFHCSLHSFSPPPISKNYKKPSSGSALSHSGSQLISLGVASSAGAEAEIGGARPFETVNGCRRCQGPRRRLKSYTRSERSRLPRRPRRRARVEPVKLKVEVNERNFQRRPFSQVGGALRALAMRNCVRVKVNAQGSPLFPSLFSLFLFFFFFSEPEVNEDSFYSCSVVTFDSPREIVEGNFCSFKVSNEFQKKQFRKRSDCYIFEEVLEFVGSRIDFGVW